MSIVDVGEQSLAEIAFAVGREVADDRNIVAVGAGAKLKNGVPEAASSIVFFVRQKVEEAALSALETRPIPAQISGFPTDVVEVGEVACALADRSAPAGARGARLADPLVGGAATMSLGTGAAGPGGYGTIGGQCFDSVTRGPLLLSNAHVWGTAANVEVVQPVMAQALSGAGVAAAAMDGSSTVSSRIPSGLVAPIAFANSIAQSYLLAGSDSDPLPTGQAGSPVAPSASTAAEQLLLAGPGAGLPPAGVRQSPTVSWSYQRLADTAVLSNTQSAARPTTKLLTARRVFTNASSYSSGQTVNIYGEIVVAPGGAPSLAEAHHVLALIHPVAAGDKFIPRVLRPVVRQAVATVSTSFLGFAAAAPGAARLPAVNGAFAVDALAAGAFVTPPGGSGLPAGTFALRFPAGSVRVFVPIGTQVVLDVDLGGIPGPLEARAINSARDQLPATVTTAPGTGTRTLVTISASEIVEVVLTGATNALLFGVTSRRSSPEASPPLCFSGAIPAAELTPKGKWAISLFVQTADLGAPESANVTETSIGGAELISDTVFDVV